jgi:hypothetical protein
MGSLLPSHWAGIAVERRARGALKKIVCEQMGPHNCVRE